MAKFPSYRHPFVSLILLFFIASCLSTFTSAAPIPGDATLEKRGSPFDGQNLRKVTEYVQSQMRANHWTRLVHSGPGGFPDANAGAFARQRDNRQYASLHKLSQEFGAAFGGADPSDDRYSKVLRQAMIENESGGSDGQAIGFGLEGTDSARSLLQKQKEGSIMVVEQLRPGAVKATDIEGDIDDNGRLASVHDAQDINICKRAGGCGSNTPKKADKDSNKPENNGDNVAGTEESTGKKQPKGSKGPAGRPRK